MDKSGKCDTCNGRGWFSYDRILNKGEVNQGYCKDNFKCRRCDATGYIGKNVVGKIGYPGRTGFVLGLPLK